MPVGGMDCGERPRDSLGRQPMGDSRILEHVRGVIEVNELVAKRLTEDQPGNGREENANSDDQPAIVRSSCPALG